MDGAITVVFTFWTAFFTFISAKELLFWDQNPVANRLKEMVRLDPKQEASIATQSLQETERLTQIKQKLLLAGLKRKIGSVKISPPSENLLRDASSFIYFYVLFF